MTVIAITGAAGFVGQHLLDRLSRGGQSQIRALVHQRRGLAVLDRPSVMAVDGDLLRPESLAGFVPPGGTLVHLAYMRGRSKADNQQVAVHLAEACRQAGVRRLIHCSTAVMADRASQNVITEATPCAPVGDYEITKLAIEEILLERSAGAFEIVILRPAAIFGPGGRNLMKLADDLSRGRHAYNYAKSCLYDRRKMNLVYVGNVAAAIGFLIGVERSLDREVFIVSDDEAPANNFRDVEKVLMDQFGIRDYRLPRVPCPMAVLSLLLRLAGRAQRNPAAVYDGQKLAKAGFKTPYTFQVGLQAFAAWYQARPQGEAVR
jgi:nucleoside-diphosphate-sugar epimerase